MKEVVLSGIRATGRLHFGNYLGAVKKFAELSKDPEKLCVYFVADLHTLTTLQEASRIKEYLPEIILDYLAAGVDPDRAIIYVQSRIPETVKLAWMLLCLTPLGELFRIPTFKEKVGRIQKESISESSEEGRYTGINAGLLSYPVLMAADILGVKANIVPVGDDQKPHLEMAADLARRFNREVAKRHFFPVPEGKTTIVVPGLSPMNPDGSFPKMGKSDGNTINLSDSPEVIRKKIRVSPTDPARVRRNDSGNPAKCPVYALHGIVSSDSEIQYCAEGCRKATIGCVECKNILAGNVIAVLEPFQDSRESFSAMPNIVNDILASGAEKARAIISSTVQEASDCFGLNF